MVRRILDASKEPKHWTAAAWWLERRYPELYALPHAREIRELKWQLAEARQLLLEARIVSLPST